MIRELSDKWAYDIDKNPIDQGEIWDVDVINQSIEMILNTLPGERLFNPFGLGIQYRLFNIASAEEAESILNLITAALKKWEDRIVVVERDMRVIANIDRNSIALIIPYIIKRTGIKSIFKKQIISNVS